MNATYAAKMEAELAAFDNASRMIRKLEVAALDQAQLDLARRKPSKTPSPSLGYMADQLLVGNDVYQALVGKRSAARSNAMMYGIAALVEAALVSTRLT